MCHWPPVAADRTVRQLTDTVLFFVLSSTKVKKFSKNTQEPWIQMSWSETSSNMEEVCFLTFCFILVALLEPLQIKNNKSLQRCSTSPLNMPNFTAWRHSKHMKRTQPEKTDVTWDMSHCCFLDQERGKSAPVSNFSFPACFMCMWLLFPAADSNFQTRS